MSLVSSILSQSVVSRPEIIWLVAVSVTGFLWSKSSAKAGPERTEKFGKSAKTSGSKIPLMTEMKGRFLYSGGKNCRNFGANWLGIARMTIVVPLRSSPSGGYFEIACLAGS